MLSEACQPSRSEVHGGFAGVRIGEAQHPGPPCVFVLQGVRDAKLHCVNCQDVVRRGYVVNTCQRCGCVCCQRCGAIRRDCIGGAGLQDAQTAATCRRSDFQGGHRGSTPSAPSQSAGARSSQPQEVLPQAQAQSVPNSAVDFGEQLSAVPAEQEQPGTSPMVVDDERQASGEAEPAAAVEADPHAERGAQGQNEPPADGDGVREEENAGEDGYETSSEVGFPQYHIGAYPEAPAGTAQSDPYATPRTQQHQSAAPRAGRTGQRGWQHLEHISLEAIFRQDVVTVQDVPRWFRAQLRRAFGVALEQWRSHPSAAAWKLFFLIPQMLLRPTKTRGAEGKAIFAQRMAAFDAGQWDSLLTEAAIDSEQARARRAGGRKQTDEAILSEAQRKIQQGELSRARLLLESQGLAPGTPATLAELRNEELRPRELTAPLPAGLGAFQPQRQVRLSSQAILGAVRSAGRGSVRDLAGMRFEHLRVLIDDDNTWDQFVALAQAFGRAEVPEEIAAAIARGRLTAMQKENGKVRGIVAGTVLRRIVAKALAKEFGDAIMECTSPFQFALQTRAGTDAVGQALRLITDLDANRVIVSLDGIGAYDHVRRASFLDKLMQTPELEQLVPFVRMFYDRQSSFYWTDDEGRVHTIQQGEGGEQGDPLMPALFALAQHEALVAARRLLHEDDFLLAFLDDLYIVTVPERARAAFDTVTHEVEAGAGVRTHVGKLRMWSRAGGTAPPGFEEYDAEVWTGNAAPAKRGIKVLGTPLGDPAFVEAHARERLGKETKFLEKVAKVPDLQCAWLLLTFCGVPRANHLLRVLPPSISAPYAKGHDDAIWQCFCDLLRCHRQDNDRARDAATGCEMWRASSTCWRKTPVSHGGKDINLD